MHKMLKFFYFSIISAFKYLILSYRLYFLKVILTMILKVIFELLLYYEKVTETFKTFSNYYIKNAH